jgi:hypothetical protein
MTRLIVLRGSLLAIVFATTGVGVRGQQTITVRRDPIDSPIAKALAAKAEIDGQNVPLADFVKDFAKRYEIPIRLDKGGLLRAHVAASVPITASFKQVPLGVALRQILRPLKLQHRVADGILIIDDVGVPLDDAHPPGRGPVGPRRAPVVRVARANRVNVAGRFNGQATVQQLRPLLQVELKFVKGLCAPTPEQMRQLKQAALNQIADLAKDMQQGNNPQRMNQARLLVQEKLAELVHAQLSPAQAALYDGEIKKRDENLRQVCARNLVVALDEELCLTAWQREKLYTELSHNWDEAWTMTVVLGAMHMMDMFPSVPDELVVPHLDAAQRALWSHLSNRNNNVFWGLEINAFLGMGPPLLDDQE